MLLAGMVALVSPVAAQDFWLQPGVLRAEPGGPIPLSLLVGHGRERERSAMPLRRILRLEAMAPGGARIDLRERLHLGAAKGDATVRLDAPGVYVIALTSDEGASSCLPAEKFNAYLAEEGLTPAIEQRKRQGRMQAEGIERYGRRTKALVQVGPPSRQAQPHLARPIGQTLELVPEANPYASTSPARLPVRAYHQGRPLAGALVKLIDRDAHARALAAQRGMDTPAGRRRGRGFRDRLLEPELRLSNGRRRQLTAAAHARDPCAAAAGAYAAARSLTSGKSTGTASATLT
jgi:hypothetical protein